MNQQLQNTKREAAKYRTKLREAEAERDSHKQRLDQVRHEMLGFYLNEMSIPWHDEKRNWSYHMVLKNPSDILLLYPEKVHEYFNSDGSLNEGMLTDKLTTLLQERPELFAPAPAPGEVAITDAPLKFDEHKLTPELRRALRL